LKNTEHAYNSNELSIRESSLHNSLTISTWHKGAVKTQLLLLFLLLLLLLLLLLSIYVNDNHPINKIILVILKIINIILLCWKVSELLLLFYYEIVHEAHMKVNNVIDLTITQDCK